MAEDKRANLPHNIILENRGHMSVSGVIDVESFDENAINLSTTRGLLGIRGEGLHIERLSVETGEMAIEGIISGVNYTDEVERGGFFSRLFG
ncbi:MAG: sporulation protein YabP [Clostridia bacterium]|nr:sporulation protein YabP [Clostridia bacterium]